MDALWNRRTYCAVVNPKSDRVILRYKATAGGETIWMGAIDTVATEIVTFEVD